MSGLRNTKVRMPTPHEVENGTAGRNADSYMKALVGCSNERRTSSSLHVHMRADDCLW
jgi:hypothetical protein